MQSIISVLTWRILTLLIRVGREEEVRTGLDQEVR